MHVFQQTNTHTPTQRVREKAASAELWLRNKRLVFMSLCASSSALVCFARESPAWPRNGSNVLIEMKIMFENTGKENGKRIIGPCLREICGKSFDSMRFGYFSGGRSYSVEAFDLM